jgi:hypothetical protein
MTETRNNAKDKTKNDRRSTKTCTMLSSEEVENMLKATRYFSYDDSQRQKLSKSEKSQERVSALLSG